MKKKFFQNRTTNCKYEEENERLVQGLAHYGTWVKSGLLLFPVCL